MLKKSQIDQFYVDVKGIDLKFPVAGIARATGESIGNVSKILHRKLTPSESFLKRFYENFPKNSKNVSRETDEDMTTMTMKPTFGEKKPNVTIEDLQKRIIQLEAEKKTLQEMIDKLLQKR